MMAAVRRETDEENVEDLLLGCGYFPGSRTHIGKEKRTSPKDYYVGLREEWKFRVEEQEGLVVDLRNRGVRIPHRRSLDMSRTNKHEYEAAVAQIKEENNRTLMRRSQYFMLQLATEMAEANDRELTENEHNNALNNEKYLSDYAMSDEDM
ncbi:hypothetical protein Vadar_019368 [Vaccinium darrowii]|uniref:Uncharacterized protein n=1 Tax=Vaccinium darrowii TaxID=229202 RepID=A0ACB7XAV8_9ERIC|nr:hypothetical protein Vadar_019368 [Vaccinium darrowii]